VSRISKRSRREAIQGSFLLQRPGKGDWLGLYSACACPPFSGKVDAEQRGQARAVLGLCLSPFLRQGGRGKTGPGTSWVHTVPVPVVPPETALGGHPSKQADPGLSAPKSIAIDREMIRGGIFQVDREWTVSERSSCRRQEATARDDSRLRGGSRAHKRAGRDLAALAGNSRPSSAETLTNLSRTDQPKSTDTLSISETSFDIKDKGPSCRELRPGQDRPSRPPVHRRNHRLRSGSCPNGQRRSSRRRSKAARPPSRADRDRGRRGTGS
jgi:hypothetical protein